MLRLFSLIYLNLFRISAQEAKAGPDDVAGIPVLRARELIDPDRGMCG